MALEERWLVWERSPCLPRLLRPSHEWRSPPRRSLVHTGRPGLPERLRKGVFANGHSDSDRNRQPHRPTGGRRRRATGIPATQAIALRDLVRSIECFCWEFRRSWLGVSARVGEQSEKTTRPAAAVPISYAVVHYVAKKLEPVR